MFVVVVVGDNQLTTKFVCDEYSPTRTVNRVGIESIVPSKASKMSPSKNEDGGFVRSLKFY